MVEIRNCKVTTFELRLQWHGEELEHLEGHNRGKGGKPHAAWVTKSYKLSCNSDCVLRLLQTKKLKADNIRLTSSIVLHALISCSAFI